MHRRTGPAIRTRTLSATEPPHHFGSADGRGHSGMPATFCLDTGVYDAVYDNIDYTVGTMKPSIGVPLRQRGRSVRLDAR